jgi:glycosyltransferase involved in cell wall biosynthesis
MQKLSVVIITLNEERNIGRCLESVKGIADEVVVVDSFSTDATRDICLAAGAVFRQEKWQGYSKTKNLAASLASYDWILSLDADEALSPELRDSLLRLKNSDEMVFCEMRRLTNYCGQWIRHCGWYPDTKWRMYDRRTVAWQGEIHEQLVTTSPQKIIMLEGDLLHYSYYTTEEHDRQLEKFSRISAQEMHARGEHAGALKIFTKTVSKFVRVYFVKLGFLDGYYGWVISVKSARESWLRYSELRRLQKNSAAS